MSTSQHPARPRFACRCLRALASVSPAKRLGIRGIPALPERLLTRSRLLDLVEEGVQGSLTL